MISDEYYSNSSIFLNIYFTYLDDSTKCLDNLNKSIKIFDRLI